MIKKLTFSAVLLTVFILVPNFVNAAFFDWASTHPLVDNDSDWSVNNVYGELLGLGITQDQQPESISDSIISPQAEPIPIPIPAQKTKTVRTAPIAIHVVMASAYSSTPDQTDDTPFITAWGTQVRDGIIAANFLPFGTLVKMPDLYGDKIFTVEDRMNK
ncbi:MAG: 3D domain-containing protein, partial [Candidatus Yanofskybacteria bacterium]|nr:3D domain-containing protein [Candidatus Yanofskybacteria bacterium]